MANKCSVSLTYCLLDTHTVVDTPICACPQAVQCSNWPCPPASLQYNSRVLEQLGWCRFAEHTTTQRVPNVVLLDVGMPTCATALAWRRSAINVAGVEPAQDHKWGCGDGNRSNPVTSSRSQRWPRLHNVHICTCMYTAAQIPGL